VDLFATWLVDHDVGEERDELRRGVPRGGLTQNLAGLGVERGVQRQGTVAEVLEAVTLES